MKQSKTAFAIATLVATPVIAAEREIPRSTQGDKGRYYLIEPKVDGNIIKTLHKRVGVNSVGYTRCEIDCARIRIRDIGYSESGPNEISPDPTNWYSLVQGSSKSDLVKFVCNR